MSARGSMPDPARRGPWTGAVGGWIVVLLLLLTACGRPLTEPEADLASRLFGDSLSTEPVRLVSNGVIGLRTHRFPARPQTTCRERIVPPPDSPWLTGRTAGIALFNRVHIRDGLFRPDFARTPDGAMSLGLAMFLAHELTHVWQWQNRELTGFSPLRVSAEHRAGTDPYLFETGDGARFLDFGYEQQASIVEEYVCCAALDPGGARTARLRALLGQVMSPQSLPPVDLILPWDGVERRGICG